MTDTPKKIFIVDDQVLIAFEMADALEDLGFGVVGSSTHLADALNVAQLEDIDVNLGRGKTSEPIACILDERKIPYVYITAYEPDQISFVDDTDKVIRKSISIPELKTALANAAAKRPS